MNRTGDVRRKKSEFSRPPIFRVFQHNRCKAAVPSLETVAAFAARHDPFHGQPTGQAKPLLVNPFFTWIGTA
jgi:hypothetical protein